MTRWSRRIPALLASIALVLPVLTAAQSARYVSEYQDPVIEEMKKKAAKKQAEREAATAAVRTRQASEAEAAEETRVFEMTPPDIPRPKSPDEFQRVFHSPPVSQDRTGGCWCFTGMSFFESEVHRLTGREIRLSEMYVIYHEYIEKARRFIQERGESRFSLGSEVNAVPRMLRLYGTVPYDAYPGTLDDTRHEHTLMFAEIKDYLTMLAEGGYWDEEPALEHVRLILNRYLGEPPAAVEFEGEQYTPKEFLQSVLKLNLDDYRVAMSTLAAPFYEKARLDVPDNWWKSEEFYNLPLDDWYLIILQAIPAGFSVGICGDTTEPGYFGEQDIAIIPDFDIPPEAIDADARELRIFNGATTDDHCIHIVGHTRIGDHDWFLVKDSSRNPHPGQFWGYIFYRDDYVRLKMLSFIAHKDAFAPIAAKLK